MNNLTYDAGRRQYVCYYGLDENEKGLFKDKRTDLKISLSYTLGGYNYFSGGQNPRGYKLFFTPVSRGGHFESFTLLRADKFESGFYVRVEEAARYNAKRLGQLAEVFDGITDTLAELYLAKTNECLAKTIKDAAAGAPVVKKAAAPTIKVEPAVPVGQKILTKEVKSKLPALYANDGKDAANVPVVVKFFDPTGSWTWYATEGEPTGETIQNGAFAGEEDYKFFGYVKGFEGELGYFTLGQLSIAKVGCKGLQALPIERDIHFGDKTLAEVMN